MLTEEFNEVIQDQITLSKRLLITKSQEYSDDGDRLHNFRVASSIQGVDMKQALGGMMAKHTVSIYDMINDENDFVMDVWEEKITDHINYLLLLKAVLVEESASKVVSQVETVEPGSSYGSL